MGQSGISGHGEPHHACRANSFRRTVLLRPSSDEPGRMSGAIVSETPVPVQTLFDYLSGGDSLEDFLRGFPNVDRNQAVAVIGLAFAAGCCARARQPVKGST